MKHFRFKTSMLNGHPGDINHKCKRVIVRGVNQGLVVTSTTDGGHSATSWHFTEPLGSAVDFGHRRPGTEQARRDLVAFQNWLLKQGADKYHELFGPDNAACVKNGVRITLVEGTDLEGAHDNHDHVAPRVRLALPLKPKLRTAATERHTSQAGVEFIARFEGFRGYAYNDPAGHATVGYGHLLHFGKVTAADALKWGTEKNPKLSRVAALRLLRSDIQDKAGQHVKRHVKVRVTQNEFDALVSLCFNIGPTAFTRSTAVSQLNLGHRRRAGAAFLLFVFAGGVKLAGLIRRRAAERRVFLR